MSKTSGKRNGKVRAGPSKMLLVDDKAYLPRDDASAAPAVGRTVWRPPRWVLIAWTALLAFGFTLGFRQITSPDLGWHLSYAQWIVENVAVPTTDPLTHTVPDRTATNPQWLFQLVILAIMSIGETAGIVVVSTLLTLAFAALLLLRTWHRVGWVPLAAIPLVALFFLGQTWQMRPHVFSWLLGSAVLLILESHAVGRRRWLWGLPAVMLLWVNLHALFILGLVVTGTYIVADVIVALLRRKPIDRQLLFVGGVSLAACLVNPYHVHSMLLPFAQLGDLQPDSVFKSERIGTAEFLSPFGFSGYVADNGRFALFIPYLYWQLYALLVVLGMVFVNRRARLVEWALFLGFFYAFYAANKNFGYFVMATFPMAAMGLDRLAGALSRCLPARSSFQSHAPLAWTSVLLLCIGLAASGWFFHAAWSNDRHGIEFNRRTLPIEAARFISEHDLQGNLLNTWNDGGYLAYATRQPVFIYGRGRVMGPDFYARYKRSREEPTTFTSLLREHQPTIAVFNPNDASLWFALLLQRSDWRLVHRDPHYVVFLHNSLMADVPEYRPDNPPQVDPDALLQRVTKVTRLSGMSVIQWLQGGAIYPRSAIDDATFYLNFGRPNAAIAAALNGLEQADYAVPDLFLRLTEALYLTRRVRLGDQTFEAFTRTDPNVEPQIRNALRRLRERAVH